MRRASRTLPGVYQLLPSWPTAVIDRATGRNVDIFKQSSWQESLVSKLAGNYGPGFFQGMLDDARDFTRIVNRDYPAGLRNKFYCIYGTGSETWRQVTVDRQNRNIFDFEGVTADEQGDGTVHELSSKVKARDRLEDRKHLIEIGGQHVQMPNHGRVQDFIVAIFTENALIRTFDSTL